MKVPLHLEKAPISCKNNKKSAQHYNYAANIFSLVIILIFTFPFSSVRVIPLLSISLKRQFVCYLIPKEINCCNFKKQQPKKKQFTSHVSWMLVVIVYPGWARNYQTSFFQLQKINLLNIIPPASEPQPLKPHSSNFRTSTSQTIKPHSSSFRTSTSQTTNPHSSSFRTSTSQTTKPHSSSFRTSASQTIKPHSPAKAHPSRKHIPIKLWNTMNLSQKSKNRKALTSYSFIRTW